MPDLKNDNDEGPEEEYSIFANRDNSAYKWQRARNVVGALEVVSEPVLVPRDDMEERYYKGREKPFKEALETWEKEELKKDFISAVDNLPVETCCCGLLQDQEETKKEFVHLLNDKWVKKANKKLSSKGLVVVFSFSFFGTATRGWLVFSFLCLMNHFFLIFVLEFFFFLFCV